MKAVRKLVASSGEYTDRNTGEKKRRWLRVGTMFKDNEGRFSIKLDSLPVGNEWSGWLSVFEMDEVQKPTRNVDAQQSDRMPETAGGYPEDGDDIPF